MTKKIDSRFQHVKVIESFKGGVDLTETNMLFYPTPDMHFVEEFETRLIRSNIAYSLVQLEMTAPCNGAFAIKHNGVEPTSPDYQDSVDFRLAKGYSIFVDIADFRKDEDGNATVILKDEEDDLEDVAL